ncbi:MAG: S1 RNA-binding domain-containing protein [Gammaproteobacteria bacterium]|nr:S1 RNA-binding domain-containing protein [Pseudomonadota bacterium]MCH9662900.1 S1 RNA-binding domain-containing protein [Gammaproteobacteria bacterium]
MTEFVRKRTPAKKAQVNDIYNGLVVRIEEHGAFINILPGKDGFIHISHLSDSRVEAVKEVLSEGARVRVKVLEIDRQGRIRLTMRGLDGEEEDDSAEDDTPAEKPDA